MFSLDFLKWNTSKHNIKEMLRDNLDKTEGPWSQKWKLDISLILEIMEIHVFRQHRREYMWPQKGVYMGNQLGDVFGVLDFYGFYLFQKG